MYGWFGIYGTEHFPDWCYVDYDPWLFGSILLGILLFLALLGLLAALLYIICYKREDKLIIETLPAKPCPPKTRPCQPCQPRLTTCASGRCGLPGSSTFLLQPTRINI